MGNNAARMVRSESVRDAREPAVHQPGTFRFGMFELDVGSGELRRNGTRIKLQEQPFQVLVHLLERPGEVVSRDELQARLWPGDTFVDFDHSLNAAIRRVRDALGDSAENPRFVETVSRRGYRFLAPVTTPDEPTEIQPPVTVETEASSCPLRRHRVRITVALSAAVALLLIGVRVGTSLGRAPASISPIRISQLTTNPADDRIHAAAISRDGRYLAFSDETGFYLRQIDTGETHSLTLPQGLRAGSISWFPDSVHMVLALSGATQDHSLWIVSNLGGEARKLNEQGNYPAVSPDGGKIAFMMGKPLHQQIWLVDSDGSQPHKVVGEEGDFFGEIAWSPDGARLAYTRGRSAYGYGVNGTIEILGLSGGDETRSPAVLNKMAFPNLDGPLAWTADGRLLYVLVDPPPHDSDSNIWWVPVDSRGNQTAPPARLTSDSGRVVGISATNDAKRIAFTKGAPEPDVYIARIEGPHSISEPQRLTLDDRIDIPYDWTTDNKSVIFISDRTGTNCIYRQAIDQNVPELLVRGSNPVETRLSPDGSQLLYVEFPKWGETNVATPLMRVPLAGGAPQTVLKEEWINNHQCARAPASICLYSLVGDHKLTFFTYDPFKGKGTSVFELKADIPQAFNWSLSPDGTTLAISEAKTEQKPRIHLVTLKNHAERWLDLKDWPGIASLDWAADSKSLWVISPGEHNALLNVEMNGRVHEVWRPGKKFVGWAIPSRDGRYLAIYVGSSSANTWMLEHP